jgi:hypothetical protein
LVRSPKKYLQDAIISAAWRSTLLAKVDLSESLPPTEGFAMIPLMEQPTHIKLSGDIEGAYMVTERRPEASW